MSFVIQEAKRELIWTKLALMGSSGSGKTYSALRLATGMLEKLKELGLEKNGKILLANTEQARGRYYANEFKYDIVDINAPHNPEKYSELIEFATSKDYPILIIDSTTHEWEGQGGCLELHQQAGGTFQSWGKVTPRHNKFIVSIADSPIHVIATMRANDQYEVEKGGNDSKSKVTKLGVGAQQRKGFEYEFTATFLIDQKSNLAEPQKDNTHLFGHTSVLLSEKDGISLINWANSGHGYTPPVKGREEVQKEEKSKSELVAEIKGLLPKASEEGKKELRAKMLELFKEFHPTGNPANISDVETLETLLARINQLTEGE